MPDDKEEITESLSSALLRLAAGAGKKADNSKEYGICSIEEDKGYSFNGTVYTQISYNFGMRANISANLLKGVLSNLTNPTVKETDKSLLFSEGGKSFRMAKLSYRAFVPQLESYNSSAEVFARGSDLKRLLTTAPSISGYNSFPGVWSGPEGYVSCEPACLGYIKSVGLSLPVILPRDLVTVLPNYLVRIGIAKCKENQTLVSVSDGKATIWHSALLSGRFPDWKGVLSVKCDRSTIVNRQDLTEALRVATTFSHKGWLEIDNKTCTVSTHTFGGLASEGHSEAKASIETDVPVSDWIKLSLDLHKLLEIVDLIESEQVTLSSTNKADRLIVQNVESDNKASLPTTFVLVSQRGVQDQTHAVGKNS